MAHCQTYDVAIVGGGIAGLSVALRLPPHLRVALFTKGRSGESNTRYAQGGLAVALGADDSPELHFQDTMAAGADLCDAEAVRILVEQAPAAVGWLIDMGVQFDRASAGSDAHTTPDGLLLGREAAHSRWRVLHAGGDATGAEIERALLAVLQAHPSIDLYEETFVSNLLVENGTCRGLEAINRDGQTMTIKARRTVLANGGAGGLWLHTSNPGGATADGLALAWHAGAALTDLEFMQFHPTVLVAGATSHLISEAVRGEGAYLRNHAGERFMPRYASQAELAPRDVVARAILSEMLAEKTDCQYLDLRHLPSEKMHARFPTISAICARYGLNFARDLLPVAPAAHYCMGGVMVDTWGRTTLPGLYAVGEVACTGVHGANRLASNSLLEGLVFGLRVADELAKGGGIYEPSRARTGFHIAVEERQLQREGASSPVMLSEAKHLSDGAQRCLASLSMTGVDGSTCQEPCLSEVTVADIRREVRSIMWQYVSLCRDQEGLLEAKQRIHELKQVMSVMRLKQATILQWAETANMLLVAELVIVAALQRCESRGSHWRLDYPQLDVSISYSHWILTTNSSPKASQLLQQEVIAHA